jgi:hypothetical protein
MAACRADATGDGRIFQHLILGLLHGVIKSDVISKRGEGPDALSQGSSHRNEGEDAGPRGARASGRTGKETRRTHSGARGSADAVGRGARAPF